MPSVVMEDLLVKLKLLNYEEVRVYVEVLLAVATVHCTVYLRLLCAKFRFFKMMRDE